MLDTTTSTSDLPLFGTMTPFSSMSSSSSSSSSSCGGGGSGSGEAIRIQMPLPTESYYSWCDFPIAVHREDVSVTSTMTTTTMAGFASTPVAVTPLNGLGSTTSSSSTSSFSSSSTTRSDIDDDEEESSTNPRSHRRGVVRFAASPRVRTYSLVLGDHPLCDDGLAIELGWDYNEEEEDDDDDEKDVDEDRTVRDSAASPESSSSSSFPQHRQQQHRQRRPGGNGNGNGSNAVCQRRSYLSRKRLLLDVAGCTAEELERLEDERRKRTSSSSGKSVEDYYYRRGLAV